MARYKSKLSRRSSNPFSLSGWISAGNHSDNFDSFKCYVILAHDSKEQFVKVGRTFCTLQYRFSGNEIFPYEYDVLHEVSDNPYHIFNLELKLKKIFKDHSYTPSIKFSGCSECFTTDIIPLLKDHINVNT